MNRVEAGIFIALTKARIWTWQSFVRTRGPAPPDWLGAPEDKSGGRCMGPATRDWPVSRETTTFPMRKKVTRDSVG